MGDAGGERVDGDDAVGVEMVLFNRFDLWAVHHQAAQVLFELAGDDHLLVGVEIVDQPGLAKPGQAQVAGAVVEDGFYQLGGAAAHRAALNGLDGADDGDFFARFQAVDGLEAAVIIVAAREEVQQVAQSVQVELGQSLGSFWADALQDGERGIQADQGTGFFHGRRTNHGGAGFFSLNGGGRGWFDAANRFGNGSRGWLCRGRRRRSGGDRANRANRRNGWYRRAGRVFHQF